MQHARPHVDRLRHWRHALPHVAILELCLSSIAGECRSLLQHVRSHVDQLRVTAAYRRVIARTCRPMTVQCPTIECLCPKMPGYGWGMVGHKNLQIFPKFSKIFENLPKFRKNRENPKKPDFCENLRKFAIFWGGPKKVKFWPPKSTLWNNPSFILVRVPSKSGL